MHRRTVLAGLGASLVTGPAPALADAPATRVFRILRNGSDIGRHALTARAIPGGFEIEIDIEIVVRILGIAAYRYELTNREVWERGRLQRLDSRANDDGDRHRLAIRRTGDTLEIDGSAASGTAPGDAATTSYYVPDFLERRPWISTQTGALLDVSVRRAQGGGRAYAVSGALETRLVYDARDEWIGSEFDAGGELARYEVVEQSGRIAALWRQA